MAGNTLALLGGLGMMTACGEGPASVSLPAPQSLSVEPGATLKLYIWEDYISEEVLADFEKETGIAIETEIFYSNEEMIEAIEGGDSGFDIACPSDYAVQVLLSKNLLAELDPGFLPNLAYLHPRFATVYYDPNKTYSVPYMWGTTGIAYNQKHVPESPKSWREFFDPAWLETVKGKVTLLDDPRETIAVALFSLGYSANTTDLAELAKAEEQILRALPYLYGFDSEVFDDRIEKGEAWVVHGWDGDFYEPLRNNPDLAFTLPESTVILSVDNMVILKESAHNREAQRFLNYLLQPEVAARNEADTGFRSCVADAAELASWGDRKSADAVHALPQENYEMLRKLPPAVQSAHDAIWERVTESAQQLSLMNPEKSP